MMWFCVYLFTASYDRAYLCPGYIPSDAIRLRDELRLLLTQLLLGDALAAEYLICHLISRV